MGKYTMNDVKVFLKDYRAKVNKKGLLSALNKMGKKAAADEQQLAFYEAEYNKVIKEDKEKQDRFVLRMTPVLNDYYSKKKK